MDVVAATSSVPDHGIPCCCGRDDCQILRRNAQVVEDLEKDVKQAASMGQALLMRHEAYMADAERERSRMSASISQLEREKHDLEMANAETIKENRDLLNQLEELNEALVESDTQVKALTTTLESTQYELQRLAVLSARTESLEQQLDQLEREQASLQNNLAVTTEDKVSAVLRWQKAERTIASLQEQMDQIEREAKEERERHIEVVGRMERRRAVEKELETAAGRLKGAAAMKTAGNDKNGSNVVSHFVKDILQDNANLQLGIVELREMLSNSNDEVQRLREQIILHQPLEDPTSQAPTPTLEAEMKIEKERDPELHIHHHYHAPATTKNDRDKTLKATRRIKKRRNVVTPGHFNPPSSRLSHSRQQSSASSILQNTSVTVPHSNRWSIQSNHTASSISSSMPSSPRTHNRRESSIFDRVFSDVAYDSSRPTSPDSTYPNSPAFAPTKGAEPFEAIEECDLEVSKPKLNRKSAVRNFSAPLPIRTITTPTTALATPIVSYSSSTDLLADLLPSPSGVHQTIPEEAEHETIDTTSFTPSTSIQSDAVITPDPPSTTSEEPLTSPSFFNPIDTTPRIRRVSSNESILSLSGMDINVYPHSHRHTLKHRPSHHLLGTSPSISATGAVVSVNTAQAHLQTLRGKDSRTLLNSSIAAAGGFGSAESTPRQARKRIGSKVGGWISGKWGATPEPTRSEQTTPIQTPRKVPSSAARPPIRESLTTPVPATASTSAMAGSLLSPPTITFPPKRASTTATAVDTASITSGSSNEASRQASTAAARPKPPKMRSAGVNQSGPLLGFFDIPPVPAKVVVTEQEVDREALGDALDG